MAARSCPPRRFPTAGDNIALRTVSFACRVGWQEASRAPRSTRANPSRGRAVRGQVPIDPSCQISDLIEAEDARAAGHAVHDVPDRCDGASRSQRPASAPGVTLLKLGALPHITGLTTAQFQSGLPAGFDPSIRGEDPSTIRRPTPGITRPYRRTGRRGLGRG